MSYLTPFSHQIICDYPGCGKPSDDWWNDQWLTVALYGEHGRATCIRHFCTAHLDTMRKAVPAGSYHLPEDTPEGWHTWGEGYMYPIYEPCIPIIMGVLREAKPDDRLLDKLVEECAIALFETDTNWAHNPPSQQEVLGLWNEQMQSVREQFKKRAFTVLRKAFELGFPNSQCPPDMRF